MAKKIVITLNDQATIRNMYQEAYNDAVNLINEATNFISTLQNSAILKDAPIEEQTKYMKAMTDMLKMKDNANKTKLDIARGLSEYSSKMNKGIKDEENELSFTKEDLDAVMKAAKQTTSVQNYKTK